MFSEYFIQTFRGTHSQRHSLAANLYDISFFNEKCFIFGPVFEFRNKEIIITYSTTVACR